MDRVASFELWVGPVDVEALAEETGAIVLRREALLEQLDLATRCHPVIAEPRGREQLRSLVSRFANFLHRSLDTPETDQTVFREGIYFLLETEVFWHWTVRQAARALARRIEPGRVMLIELGDTRLRYGLLWDDNELWPLSLAHELNRNGGSAVLYLHRPDGCNKPISAIDVVPGPGLVRDQQANLLEWLFAIASEWVPANKVFCPKTVRNWKIVNRRLNRPLRLMTGLDRARPRVRIDITPTSEELDGDCLPLTQLPPTRDGVARYRGVLPRCGLAKSIVRRIDKAIGATFNRAMDIVDRRKVLRFDTADHPTLEGCVFGAAVKQAGGRVILWPHASNPIAVGYRAPLFDVVIAPTTLSAKQWRQQFPNVEVRVDPTTVFPPLTFDAPRKDTGEVTLVIFGIRCFTGGMPRFNFERHEKSLRMFIESLSKERDVRVIYKPKDRFDLARFDTVIDPNRLAERTDLKFSSMSWPNMVFASPTNASTAIIEGIFRGVPAVLLRDTPAWDHIPFDAKVVPILEAEAMIERILELRNSAAYDELSEKQAEWLRSILKEPPGNEFRW